MKKFLYESKIYFLKKSYVSSELLFLSLYPLNKVYSKKFTIFKQQQEILTYFIESVVFVYQHKSLQYTKYLIIVHMEPLLSLSNKCLRLSISQRFSLKIVTNLINVFIKIFVKIIYYFCLFIINCFLFTFSTDV